jgi:pimeloyl-ACP methyl ester carboxylesterase
MEEGSMLWIALGLGIPAGVVGVSYLVEALRTAPATPDAPPWAPDRTARYVDAAGVRLRYLVAGRGPDLILLHTLRTQLDMFQRVIPLLTPHFRVYALDLPGHGHSDIPTVDYTADFFVETVAAALDRLGVRDAVLVGESIGGSIALQLAARHHPRVARVVAVNPYDYDGGRGIRRSSVPANLLFGVSDIPLVGDTVARLRSLPIVRRVLQGGVRRRASLPPALVDEIYRVGNRPGHRRAFSSLVRHWAGWDRGRSAYTQGAVPVTLVYGEHDWSRGPERAADARDIPGAELRVVPDAGHFLSLDAPEALAAAVVPGTPAAAARAPA